MANPAHEFQRLCDRRDVAALNCVNAIQFVLAVWEAQTFAESRQMLEDALAGHKCADQAITEFHRQHKLANQKENHDGNRSAA